MSSSSSFDSHSQRQEQDSFKRACRTADHHRRLIPAVDRAFYHHHHPTAPNSSSTTTRLLPKPLPKRTNPTRVPFTSSNPNTKSVVRNNKQHRSSSFSGALTDDDLVAAVVPPVTVVVEGRCICHRISLHKHDGYQSFARALRRMFAVDDRSRSSEEEDPGGEGGAVDLKNAVPGYLIAYEDMENDLLLAGDLNWKDFVRVAKRIRILPAKAKCSRN